MWNISRAGNEGHGNEFDSDGAEDYDRKTRESKEWINNPKFVSESMDFNEAESVIWRKVITFYT
jgi:hypothetical protein